VKPTRGAEILETFAAEVGPILKHGGCGTVTIHRVNPKFAAAKV
jgi:hypothetical protein